MKFFLLLLILLPTLVGAQRALDLSRFNPAPQRIEGISFPRTGELLYRGASPVQYDRNRALKAMFGMYEPMESILYSAVKLLLMKQRFDFFETVRPTLTTRGLLDKVNEEIQKNGGKAFDLDSAHRKAFRILEDDLLCKAQGHYFRDHYVDYRSPYHELFPQDMLFATVYLEVANIYAKNITVIDDQSKQMLDLNFWNKVHNGDWVFTTNEWVDKGEFISPLIIEPEKVVGFMEYLSVPPYFWVYRPLPEELNLAFMKQTVGKETYVLIFDGSKAPKAPAILNVKGIFHQADSQFNHLAEIPKPLKARKETAFLVGIMKLCPQTEACKLETELFSKYRRSKRLLTTQELEVLKQIQVERKVAKLFYQNATLTKDQWTSAPYEVVFPASRTIVDKEIASTKHKRVEIADDAIAVDARILKWDLKKRKLGKDEAIYFTIPERLRSKKLTKISLLQRQAEEDNSTALRGRFDDSPAYTSVQVYALSEDTDDLWRYWGGTFRHNNPKGSVFGELVAEDRMQPWHLEPWTNTKGVNSDKSLSGGFGIGALRLVGIGTDPATLYSIQLEFEP